MDFLYSNWNLTLQRQKLENQSKNPKNDESEYYYDLYNTKNNPFKNEF